MEAIRHTCAVAWRDLSRKPDLFVMAIAVPGALAMLLVLLEDMFSMPSGPTWIATILVNATLTARVHRYLLLTEHGMDSPLPTADFLHCAGWIAAVPLSVFMYLTIFILTNSLLPLVLAPAFVYCISRVSLILPNRATGRREGLREIWALSDNNGWKLAGVLLVPVLVIEVALYLAFTGLEQGLRDFLFSLCRVPVQIYLVVLQAVAYRELLQNTIHETGGENVRDESSNAE